MTDLERRRWLIRRIETEAWAYARANALTREICWGRLLGLLEVGAAFGYWSRRTADAFSETVRNRYRIGRAVRRLRRSI